MAEGGRNGVGAVAVASSALMWEVGLHFELRIWVQRYVALAEVRWSGKSVGVSSYRSPVLCDRLRDVGAQVGWVLFELSRSPSVVCVESERSRVAACVGTEVGSCGHGLS